MIRLKAYIASVISIAISSPILNYISDEKFQRPITILVVTIIVMLGWTTVLAVVGGLSSKADTSIKPVLVNFATTSLVAALVLGIVSALFLQDTIFANMAKSGLTSYGPYVIAVLVFVQLNKPSARKTKQKAVAV